MRIIELAVLTLIALGFSGRQQTSSPASTVEGVVVEAASGRPIADVQVSTDQSSSREVVRSDESGRFRLTNVPPGLRSIIVRKQGYAPAVKLGQWRSAALVQMDSGKQVQGVLIRLVRGGTISGRVEANNQVNLARYTYGPGGVRERRTVETVMAAKGPENAGEYQFDGLPPGEYYVYLSPFPKSSTKGEAFAITYYPGTVHPSAAAPITVKPSGQVRLNDFSVSSTAAPSVRVRLENATGNPAVVQECAVASLKTRADTNYDDTRELSKCSNSNSSEERSRLNAGVLAPGIYDIYAGWQMTSPAGSTIEGAAASFEVRNVDLEVEIVVSHARMTGRMMMEQPDGSLVPAAGLQLTLNPTRLGPAIWAVTTLDGSFQYDQVLRAEYTAEISPLPPDAYIAQLTAGDRNVLRDGLEVQSTNFHVNGIISKRGAQVRGSVTDSKNQRAPGSIVVLVPDAPLRNEGHLYKTTVTDQDGEFTIRGIAPGSYRMFAWPQLDGAAYRNAEFMQKVDGRGKPVVVGKDASVSVDVTLLDDPL